MKRRLVDRLISERVHLKQKQMAERIAEQMLAHDFGVDISSARPVVIRHLLSFSGPLSEPSLVARLRAEAEAELRREAFQEPPADGAGNE